LVIFLFIYGTMFSQKETVRIRKTLLVKSKSEAVKYVEKYLNENYDNVYVSKTVWTSDIEAGYKYEVEASKYLDNGKK